MQIRIGVITSRKTRREIASFLRKRERDRKRNTLQSRADCECCRCGCAHKQWGAVRPSCFAREKEMEYLLAPSPGKRIAHAQVREKGKERKKVEFRVEISAEILGPFRDREPMARGKDVPPLIERCVGLAFP